MLVETDNVLSAIRRGEDSMSGVMTGRGMMDAIEIQRQFNEFEAHIARQIRLSGSEDPFERIRQIAAAQRSLKAKTDELLEAYVEQEKRQ